MTHECSCRRFSANQFGLLKHGLRGLFLLVWRITLFPQDAFDHDPQFGANGFLGRPQSGGGENVHP
jgi:hypothetical protein